MSLCSRCGQALEAVRMSNYSPCEAAHLETLMELQTARAEACMDAGDHDNAKVIADDVVYLRMEAALAPR